MREGFQALQEEEMVVGEKKNDNESKIMTYKHAKRPSLFFKHFWLLSQEQHMAGTERIKHIIRNNHHMTI